MKTIGGLLRVLVAVGVCFAVPATAQIHTSRGSFVLGSRVGFSTASSDVEVKGDGIDFNGDGGSAYQINVQGVSRSSTTRTNAFDFSVGIQYYFGGAARRAAGSDRLRDIMAPNGSRQ